MNTKTLGIIADSSVADHVTHSLTIQTTLSLNIQNTPGTVAKLITKTLRPHHHNKHHSRTGHQQTTGEDDLTETKPASSRDSLLKTNAKLGSESNMKRRPITNLMTKESLHISPGSSSLSVQTQT